MTLNDIKKIIYRSNDLEITREFKSLKKGNKYILDLKSTVGKIQIMLYSPDIVDMIRPLNESQEQSDNFDEKQFYSAIIKTGYIEEDLKHTGIYKDTELIYKLNELKVQPVHGSDIDCPIWYKIIVGPFPDTEKNQIKHPSFNEVTLESSINDILELNEFINDLLNEKRKYNTDIDVTFKYIKLKNKF